MNGPLRRPAEFELHALVDGRLDPLRAAEIETLLAAAGERDRVEAWLRGRDALRLVYDPLAHEPPPAFLALSLQPAAAPAAKPGANQGARPGSGPAAPRAAARSRPAAESRATIWLAVITGFCLGATATLIGSALIARLGDRAGGTFAAALWSAVAGLGRGLGLTGP